jgi:hypothetical protein
VALVALHEARDVGPTPTYAEITLAAVRQLEGLETQAEVRKLLGRPHEIYRNNPRAQCWRYTAPYELQMCFGAKRRLAWWAGNVPLEHPPEGWPDS